MVSLSHHQIMRTLMNPTISKKRFKSQPYFKYLFPATFSLKISEPSPKSSVRQHKQMNWLKNHKT